MDIIARIYNDYDAKFGVPRQSGLVNETTSEIIFEPEYRVAEAFRGLEQFDYIWLIWQFSECDNKEWSPTVRPPRLGGNKRMGVFATRSPFRPNSIGLSSVRLKEIKHTQDGPVLIVAGADLMNGTPIYDIKPYLPYVDSHPDASNGFAMTESKELKVSIPDNLYNALPGEKMKSLISVLSQDPRPQYIDEPDRIYGMTFAGKEIKFSINENGVVVTAIEDKE